MSLKIKMEKTVLLIRKSDFQYYLANELFKNNIIQYVIIEDGSSLSSKFNSNIVNIIKKFKLYFGLKNILFKVFQLLKYDYFYGNREFHNLRILRKKKIKINKKIKIFKISNINNDLVKKFIRFNKITNVILFGTRLLDYKKLKNLVKKIINIHWGFSPYYRGEGILTCLARNDLDRLGVTIHEVSEKVDFGKIIKRKKVRLDSKDNFYSIGLKMTLEALKIICKKNFFKNQNNFLLIRDKGFFYDSNYIKKNYQDYFKAYLNLKKIL